jgi:hypothetical protein
VQCTADKTAPATITAFGILLYQTGSLMCSLKMLQAFTALVLRRHLVADIERSSLDAHVSICEQRYLNLDNRMTGLEDKVERIEKLLGDIHQKIDSLGVKQNKQINSTLIYIIGLLLTICGGLIAKMFF